VPTTKQTADEFRIDELTDALDLMDLDGRADTQPKVYYALLLERTNLLRKGRGLGPLS